MKHPGPWSIEAYTTSPPRPYAIVSSGKPGSNWVLWASPDRRELAFRDDESRSLILAAPVLLEGMRALLDDDGPRDMTPFNLLVDYLDGKPGTNEIDLDEFMKWLRTGTGAVVTTDYRDVEGERDELLASLKNLVAGMEYDKGMGAYDEAVALIDRIEKGEQSHGMQQG